MTMYAKPLAALRSILAAYAETNDVVAVDAAMWELHCSQEWVEAQAANPARMNNALRSARRIVAATKHPRADWQNVVTDESDWLELDQATVGLLLRMGVVNGGAQ